MPPFEYKPFVNPYIGSISELMGKGDEAKAAALIRIGEIQARAAEQQGQAWGNAIQGLGNIGAEYLSPKAREARAIEKGQKILDANAKRRITEQGQRMTENTFQPSVPYKDFVPNSAVNPFDAPFRNVNFGVGSTPRVTTDETFALAQAGPNGEIIENALPNEGLRNSLSRLNAFGPTDGVLGAPPQVARPDALSRGMEGALGHMREGQTLPTGRAPQVETYEKASRNRYTTAQGLYDVRLAYDDLIEAGISTKVAMALAGQGQQANSIFAAYDKDKEELDKKQIAVRGSIANMAIQLMNTGMSAQDALTQASGPAGNRISQDDMNAFAVQLNSQPTEQGKRQLFVDVRNEWDAQSPQKVLGRDDIIQGISGAILGEGRITPPPQKRAPTETEIQLAAVGGDPVKFVEAYRRSPTPIEIEMLIARGDPLALVMQGNRALIEKALQDGLDKRARISAAARSGSGAATGPNSLASVVFNTPSLFKGLTPTAREELIPTLAGMGFNFNSLNDDQDGVAILESALPQLMALDPSMTQKSGAAGVLEGLTQMGMSEVGMDPIAKTYAAIASPLPVALSRASGEVGNLAIQEQQRFEPVVPTGFDPYPIRQAKYAAIDAYIQIVKTRSAGGSLSPEQIKQRNKQAADVLYKKLLEINNQVPKQRLNPSDDARNAAAAAMIAKTGAANKPERSK